MSDGQTGEPLFGAYLYIHDLQKGSTTDTQGNYQITNLPSGTFVIEVGFLGYGRRVVKTKIEGSTSLDIELTPAVTEMSEIVVTGISASTERHLNPVPTAIVSLHPSNSFSGNNIIDIIANEPGIDQISTGGAISKPVIRGLGFNRVVVLNNGIRQEGQQWGDEHGIEIDQYSIDRVEIIKGSGSLMYGSDAIAGVIHFLPPKPVDDGQIVANFSGGFQSNNGLMGYSLMNAGNMKGLNWRVLVSGKRASNYSNSFDGKVYNSGFEELNVSGTLGINKIWGFSNLHFGNFNQSLGLVEGERNNNGDFLKLVTVNGNVEEQTVSDNDLTGYDINFPKQDINHLKIGSNNRFVFNNSLLSVNFAYQQNNREEFADPLNPLSPELFFRLNTFNYDTKFLLPENKDWQTSIGINGMRQESENKGKEFIIPEYSLFDIGAYMLSQKSFEKTHISGGLRYDTRVIWSDKLLLNPEGIITNENDPSAEIKFDSFNTSFSNISGSLGVSHHLSDKSILKLNLSRGFRSPNLAELGSNGIHEGTFRYEIGDSQLAAETSLQFDMGLLYNSEHVSFEVAVFNNSIQNYIYLQKLNSSNGGDSIIDISDPAPLFKFTQGNARLVGGEVVIDIHPHPLDWLHIENSFSYVRGIQLEVADSLRNLPFIPAPKIKSQIRGNIKKLGSSIRSAFIMLETNYTFAQNNFLEAFDTESATGDYLLVNAGLGTEIINKKGDTFLTISFTANNIFDKAYQSHLSRLKYASENIATGRNGVFNMGRNFSISFSIPLVLKSD